MVRRRKKYIIASYLLKKIKNQINFYLMICTSWKSYIHVGIKIFSKITFNFHLIFIFNLKNKNLHRMKNVYQVLFMKIIYLILIT